MITNLHDDEQHQHKRGHGWIANSAHVADTVYVGPHALVYGKADLSERVRVEDFAQVSGTAKLLGDCVVSGNCWIDHGTFKTGRFSRNERVQNKQERLRPAENGL